MLKKISTTITPKLQRAMKKNPSIPRSRGFHVAALFTHVFVDQFMLTQHTRPNNEKDIYKLDIGYNMKVYLNKLRASFPEFTRVEGVLYPHNDYCLRLHIHIFTHAQKVGVIEIPLIIRLTDGEVIGTGSFS